MKTIANNSSVKSWMVLFCLVLSAVLARSQSSGGIFANDGVRLVGNETIDSFDSSDPNHSIWQTNSFFRRNYFNPSGTQYGIWSNSLSYISNSFPSRTANVSVFTDSNVVSLSDSIIAGYVMTGPAGTVSGGANFSIGDLAWCFGPGGGSGQIGIEPGHWTTNVNVNLQSYPLPSPVNSINGWMNWSNVPAPPKNSVISIGGMWTNSAGAWSYVGGTRYTNTGSGFNIGGTTYPLVITNRLENTNWVYYSMNQLSQSIFVDAQYVVLYLTNGWSYSGKTVFTLNTNADIKVVTTGSIFESGTSQINNMNGYSRAFSLYDVAGYPVSVSLTGNTAGYYFIPSSSMALPGGGTSEDFVGSITCYSLNDDAGISIHYDQSLGTSLSSPTVQPLLSYDFIPAKDWFICHLVGVTGLDYTIDASTDLVNWVPVWTNTSPFVFTDTNVNNYQQRFFRPVPGP